MENILIKTNIQIENLKCGGCGNSIKNGLTKIAGVVTVNVDLENSQVEVTHTEGVKVADLKATLLNLGYPETGTVEGLSALTANIKSFVSCATGRMSNSN